MNGSGPNPTALDIAHHLIAFEAVAEGRCTPPAFLVCEKMRRPLTTLTGAEGFRSLVVRALTLARREAPTLNGIKVREDGSIDGPETSATEPGGAALIAQLLGLLITFIGDALTMRLLYEIWPDLLGLDLNSRGEDRMAQHDRVKINKLPTGAPGLDEILGGGLPEFSFNIIGGAPGSGKTTLAHQIIFANATTSRPAIYFTVLGEPALKMLRYQQQYSFFDVEKLHNTVHFINLSEVLLARGLTAVLEEIGKQVETFDPGIVIVDSFRSVMRTAEDRNSEVEVQAFIQQLAMLLASSEATTFLIGEYSEPEMRDNPAFTVADGIFWLYVERNSVVRKLQIMKLRGQMSVPGMHTFRITDAGLQAFSRTLGLAGKKLRNPSDRRLSTGIAALDEMMGGGIPEGDSLLIAGSSGTGKSLLATQFIAAGIRNGEPGIVVIFEERAEDYAVRASVFGLDLKTPLDDGTLEVIYLRPLDLSVDEMMQEILDAVERTGAKRLVIDSLDRFELALAPGFRTDFRESLYRMILALTRIGITIMSTLEMEESFTELRFSTYSISFLTDDIIRMRYVEIDGQLHMIMMVVKMCGGAHSKDIREYRITTDGIVIGDRLTNYVKLITGIPKYVGPTEEVSREGDQ